MNRLERIASGDRALRHRRTEGTHKVCGPKVREGTRVNFVYWPLLLAGVVTAAAAQTSNPDASTKLVTRSALGAWMLNEDPAHPRLNCSVKFLPGRKGQPSFTILGPTRKMPSGVILFSGADIPPTPSPKDIQVELLQQTLASTRLRATLLPRQPDHAEGALAVAAGDIAQAMKSMRDSEHDMQIRLEGSTVFALDYDGLALARDSLLNCLEGRRFSGATLREATADIRPLGTSVIKGQAFFKSAVLAPKKYPPKGTEAIGLIWMTDEFKAWHEQVKRDKKMPSHIPQNILKHFVRTKVLDDQGSFRFTNMPAGEYLLIADYSFEKTVNQEEVIGRTDVFVGGNYIGSNAQITVGTYAYQQGLTFEKRVVVPTDGQTIEVTLDKSQIMCFLVCF